MPKITTAKKSTVKKLPVKSMGNCPKCAGMKLQRIRKPDGQVVGRCPRCRREYKVTGI